MEFNVVEMEIGKLELKAGDILVVKLDLPRIPKDHQARILERLEKMLSPMGATAILMPLEAKIEIARSAEKELPQ